MTMTPENIGRYEIKSELGRGGMATVYTAYDPLFERTVAVKVLPREFLHETEFRARFTREARTIAALEHPAIVPVYDFGEDGGQPFLVMRLMPGGSLADRVAQGPLSIEESAAILQRLGSALDRAHSQGIIHRDLKPSNVLFDQYGDAFLADFGIAHLASASDALTASGSLVGTPTYMSPEQVYGDKELDGRSDIYALGVILFQMLTGFTPYDAETPARMMMKHVMDPVPQILSVRPDLPAICDEIITKAMAKQREERFSTAQDLSKAVVAITQRSDQSDLHAELAAMQSELEEASEAAGPPVTVPEPVAVVEPTVPQPLPTAATGSGSGIPKWVLGLIAALAVLCVAAVIGVGALVGNRLRSASAAATAAAGQSLSNEAVTAGAVELPTTAASPVLEPSPTATLAATTAATATQPPPTAGLSSAEAALATRESLLATRAAATATTAAGSGGAATPVSGLAPLFGPVGGTMPHLDDDLLESVFADVSPADFVLAATFGNPFAESENSWDFGVIFRQQEADDEYRLVVESSGAWSLDNREAGTDTYLQEGEVGNYLQTGADGRNRLELIVAGDTGYFFLNQAYIATLDLSGRLQAGDLAIGTGFFTGNEKVGEATGYSDFAVWPAISVYGPRGGQLEHALDDLIKLQSAGVDQRNFLAQATFTNPFAKSENDWDFGFGFRAEGGVKYWLIVRSEGEWKLVERQGEADSDETRQSGQVKNLNVEADGRNELTLIAWGDNGYAFVNDRFIERLDLSTLQQAGDIQVVTAFDFDHELEGRATGYEAFTIWPLP